MSHEDILEEMGKVESLKLENDGRSLEAELEKYLISHPEFIQKWLEEKVSPETLHKLLEPSPAKNHLGSSATENCTNNSHHHHHHASPSPETMKESAEEGEEEERAQHPRPHHPHHGLTDEEVTVLHRAQSRSKRNSITSDRFQTWLSSSALTASPKHPKPSGNGSDQSEAMLDHDNDAGETSSSAAGTTLWGASDKNESAEKRLVADSAENNPNRLFQLQHLDENQLFIELVKDISNELNIDILCHKILVNVGFLTQGDRCSLFLARGPQEQRYLVAKLFDVTIESGKGRKVIPCLFLQ